MLHNSLSTYLSHVEQGALRWLHAMDLDPTSKTYGIADRDFWAWKTKDFPNATWQGGIAGFLDSCSLLNLERNQITKIVRACLYGTKTIQRSNGSFEEAYPYESSVCVTGLVIFSLGYAFIKYPHFFTEDSKDILHEIFLKAYRFLVDVPETHGLISNHLATVGYALALTRKILHLEDSDQEIQQVLNLQDPNEFWFPEYGGADPGYQTLLAHYLIAGGSVLFVKGLPRSLDKSLAFISNFCFPDGSFSGEIGNRGTAIFYPSGSLQFSEDNQLRFSKATHWFLTLHLNRLDCLTPITIDSGNFVPLFNSWAFCLKIIQNTKLKENFLPFKEDFIHLDKAGLIISHKEKSFMIASVNKATIRKGILDESGCWHDESLVGFINNDYTTQGIKPFDIEMNCNSFTWKLAAHKRVQKLNRPFYSIILRLTAYSIYRLPFLQKIFKKLLAKFVMTYGQSIHTPIRLHVDLKSPDHRITIHHDSGWQKLSFGFHYHMASANTLTMRQL